MYIINRHSCAPLDNNYNYRGLRTDLLQNISYAIAHPDFDDSYSALYDDDGVHLSFIGKDICINTIQEALFQFLRYPNCNCYPMEHMSVD
jgi:hypothetical protein